jgi:hypothetical protein
VACGYRVDSSVTPFVSWEPMGGPSFVGAPLNAYRIGEQAELTVPHPDGPLAEIPMTCGYTRFPLDRWAALQRRLAAPAARALHLAGFAARLGVLKLVTLSPETATVADMLALSRRVVEGGVRHLQLSFHSPTLSPGLSIFARTTGDVQRLYRSIERYVEGLAHLTMVRFATVSEAEPLLGPHPSHSDAAVDG